MYEGKQRQIDQHKSEILAELSGLGFTDVKSYYASVGVDKSFTFRSEHPATGIFSECSCDCRKIDDHDSHLCCLKGLLSLVKRLTGVT